MPGVSLSFHEKSLGSAAHEPPSCGRYKRHCEKGPIIIKSRMTDFIIDGGLFVSGIFFSYLIDTMLALFQIIRKGKDYL